jgi:hypothetical protein
LTRQRCAHKGMGNACQQPGGGPVSDPTRVLCITVRAWGWCGMCSTCPREGPLPHVRALARPRVREHSKEVKISQARRRAEAGGWGACGKQTRNTSVRQSGKGKASRQKYHSGYMSLGCAAQCRRTAVWAALLLKSKIMQLFSSRGVAKQSTHPTPTPNTHTDQ